jgi:hypothetical protein
MCFVLRPPDAGHDDVEAALAFDRSIRAEMTAQAERAASTDAAASAGRDPDGGLPAPEDALLHT